LTRLSKVGAVPKSLRLTGVLVLAAALPMLAACDGPPPKPPGFNNRIALNNAKWNAAVVAFRKTIEPLSQNQDVSPAAAQTAYDLLAKEFKEVKRASRRMPVPSRSPSGQAYRDKYWEYLDVQEELLDNEVKRIVATIADGKLNATAKWRAIWPILGEIEKKERPTRDALLKAQSEFGSAYKLTFTVTPSK
jgi:hypothetical protein